MVNLINPGVGKLAQPLNIKGWLNLLVDLQLWEVGGIKMTATAIVLVVLTELSFYKHDTWLHGHGTFLSHDFFRQNEKKPNRKHSSPSNRTSQSW